MSLAVNNINCFLDVIGEVLGRLYTKFPMPIDIDIEEIMTAALPDIDMIEEAPAELFTTRSIAWLALSRLVDLPPQEVQTRLVEGVVLSPLGLNLLLTQPKIGLGSKGYELASRVGMAGDFSRNEIVMDVLEKLP